MDMAQLLEYAKGKEPLYNKIGNILYENFGVSSAEINLITLFVYDKLTEKEKE